jgi:multicomponent Na+:H+ antiporter subunit G
VKDIVVIVLCCIGVMFSLTAAVGLLRMPDVYNRIQCSTQLVTLGALPILIAVTVFAGPVSQYGSRALIVGALLLILAPAASHALGRAAYLNKVPMWPGSVRDEPRD